MASDFTQLRDVAAADHPAYKAFVHAMADKSYGAEPLNNAWGWFKTGWIARSAYPGADTAMDWASGDWKALLDEATRKCATAALSAFAADPHQFSLRGCATCRAISVLIGPWGCTALDESMKATIARMDAIGARTVEQVRDELGLAKKGDGDADR